MDCFFACCRWSGADLANRLLDNVESENMGEIKRESWKLDGNFGHFQL